MNNNSWRIEALNNPWLRYPKTSLYVRPYVGETPGIIVLSSFIEDKDTSFITRAESKAEFLGAFDFDLLDRLRKDFNEQCEKAKEHFIFNESNSIKEPCLIPQK